MATVIIQPGVGLTLKDETGSLGQFRLFIRQNTTAAAGLSAAAALRSLVNDLSDCSIISERYTLTAEEQNPAPGAGNRTGVGVFVFETGTVGEYLVIAVPGITPSFVMTTGPGLGVDLDVAAPAIADFIDGVLSGPWCNPFGYQPTILLSAIYEIRPS